MEIHWNQNIIPQRAELSCMYESVNFRIFRVARIDGMFLQELCFILLEPIGNEDGNIILPGIAGRGR